MSDDEKARHRHQLALDVAAFLEAGGEITSVDHTANHSYQQPATRSRRAQVEYFKRMTKG